MRLVSIASGSSGNCVYVGTDTTSILVDAGISRKRIELGLEEIGIKEQEDGKLIWECPSCGNRNQDKMFVARRTCGYIGTQFWNQGRTQEIKDRVLHL